mgnify:CR=1 FL=1
MRKELKEERGVTLVALVITVIVLIILAWTTLGTLIGDNGIITKAQEASQNMENASREEDELIQNLLNDIKGAEGGNGGEIEIPEGTIEFGEVKWSNGQAEVEIIAKPGEGESLQYQINGTNEGSWQNIASGNKVSGLHHNDEVHARLWDGSSASVQKSKKIEDTKVPEVSIQVGKVTDSSIEVTVQAVENESGLLDVETYEYCIGEYEAVDGKSVNSTYEYKNGLQPETEYKLTVKVRDKAGNEGKASINQRTDKVQLPTIETTLKEGDYVLYEDANGVQQKCMVLYGPYSGYGIQIITEKIVEKVILGSSDFNESKDSYNNAIATLNTKADKYRKKEDGIAEIARCVGSVPYNPNYDGPGMHTTMFGGIYSGKLKEKDKNYKTDYDQMSALGINDIGQFYWLASRHVDSISGYSDFYVRYLMGNGELHYSNVCAVYSDGRTKSHSDEYGLRIVIHLKSGIKVIEGDGNWGRPYILAP